MNARQVFRSQPSVAGYARCLRVSQRSFGGRLPLAELGRLMWGLSANVALPKAVPRCLARFGAAALACTALLRITLFTRSRLPSDSEYSLALA